MIPRISAIMPTADRRAFVPGAIAAFLAQAGAGDAELLILDDGDDPVGDLVPDDPRIRYVRETPRRQIGDKRNRMCALARGEIIVHWDDDDWHLPDRIARQVAALESSGAQICGLDRILFLAQDGGEAWEYVWGGRERWVYGASLAYRRSYWQSRNFPHLAVGEDTRWVMQAPAAAVHAMAENDILVARVHPGNTSPKQTRGGYYHGRDPGPLRALIEQAGVRPAEPLSPPATLRNVHAVLVHEKPECVIDLVRNLRHLDPESPILLYDGSPGGTLLDPRLPWSAWGCEIVPSPRPMKWGTLHEFALGCIRTLGIRGYDVLTIVDSDQLMLRGGYGAYLARTLAGRDPRRVVLTPDPAHQGPDTRIPPARTAQLERELWQPFLARFEGGEAKFVHWTFWPATVIGADAGRAIAALFQDSELQSILARSSLWATEEILFPTLAALLGFEVVRNPCRSDFVQYRTPWRISDIDRALGSADAFFVHPVPRVLDDRLRIRVRERHGGYRGPPAAASGPGAEGALWPAIAAMREIDGWLSDEEGEALLLAARSALARPTPLAGSSRSAPIAARRPTSLPRPHGTPA
jgi:hypothetical protein